MNLVLLDEYSLKEKCAKVGYMKYWTMINYKIAKLEAETGAFRTVSDRLTFEKLEALERKVADYVLVTVRPKVISVPELLVLSNRIVGKKWLRGCLWCLEQKGTVAGEMGAGAHFHALVVQTVASGRKKSVNSMVDEIFSTCQSLNVNILKNCIDIKLIPKKDLGQVENYLVGDKKDLKKREVQIVDRLWRVKNDLKEYYGSLIS